MSVLRIKTILQKIFISLPQGALGHIEDLLTGSAGGLVVKLGHVCALTSLIPQLTTAKDPGRCGSSSLICSFLSLSDLHSWVGGFVGNSLLLLGCRQ